MSDFGEFEKRFLEGIAGMLGLSYEQFTGPWAPDGPATVQRYRLTWGQALNGPRFSTSPIMEAQEVMSHFNGHVRRTSPEAVLIRPKGGTRDEDFWAPRSVIKDGDTLEEGDRDLDIARWWLLKKGLV